MRQFNNGLLTIAGASFLTILVTSLPLLMNENFYFEDDWQGYYMPVYLEVARLIKSGNLPLLTDRLWIGGMHLGEYQTAIFHPVSVSLYLVLDKFSHLNIAAAVFTIFHLALFAAGAASISLLLGCNKKSSFVAGVMVATMPSLIFWGAKMWITIVISMAWFAVAIAILILAYKNKKWLPLAVLTNTLVFLSGWPLTNLALMLTVFFSVVYIYLTTKDLLAVSRLCLSVIFGLMLAAPAILPVAETMKYSARFLDPDQWKTSIDMIPAIGVPTFATTWKNFAHNYAPVVTPLLYVSWFIPLLLINTSWKKLWYEKPLIRLHISLTLLFMVIVMLPGFWQFRWSFRFIPVLHFFLIMLAAYIMTNDSNATRDWFSKKSLLTLIIPFYIAWAYTPTLWLYHILFFSMIVLFVVLHTKRQAKNKNDLLLPLTGNVLILLMLSVLWPVNNQGYPIAKHSLDRSSYSISEGRRLALYNTANSQDPKFWSAVAPGNRSLYHYRESINGYSPIFPIGFKDKYCLSWIGSVCPQLVEYLFTKEKITGLRHIDLLNLTTIVAEKGIYSDSFEKYASDEWQITNTGSTWNVFTRSKPASTNNNLFASANLKMSMVESKVDKLVLNIETTTTRKNDNLLIWSRPWYPGWRAYLDGNEIDVVRAADVLIGIPIPVNSKGVLTIEYWPKSLTVGLWIFTVSLIAVIIWSFFIFKPAIETFLRRFKSNYSK